MLESLKAIDESLFFLLHEIGHPHLNDFMWWMSNRYIWFPMYALLIFRLYKTHGKTFYHPLIMLILVVLITDQVTASLMKPFFERLRPCHHPEIAPLVKLVGNCGGKYSFASSHAANTFGLASLFFFYERFFSKVGFLLILWAAVVSYSRVYLGVHFPGDILVGGLIGLLTGYFAAAFLHHYKKIKSYK